MKKPKVLYHASPNREIDIFEPRRVGYRDPNEGPVVFATPDKALASIFMLKTDEKWSKIGRFTDNGVTTPWHLVVSSRRRLKKADSGGAIYSLPPKTFDNSSQAGMGETEWVSKVSVKPLKKEVFESGVEEMIKLGVEVFVVSRKELKKMKPAEDHGLEIIKKLRAGGGTL